MPRSRPRHRAEAVEIGAWTAGLHQLDGTAGEPKSMYHWDDALPQFKKSSTLVVKTVSGNELISGFMKTMYSPDTGFKL